MGDVSRAWLVWSAAAEAALADAYRFAGGPVPIRGPVLGRGSAWLRVVRSEGPKVHQARSNAADIHEAGDVFMHRDSSIDLCLTFGVGLRLSWMCWIQGFGVGGVSLARSVELTVQWDEILWAGHAFPFTLGDLQSVREGGIGDLRRVTLADFDRRVVVHRGDEAIGGWRKLVTGGPSHSPL